jgi:AcrR family transcriptional regulator
MSLAFENLSKEKKQKIIAACLEEFTSQGYKNASTNNIVKKAEISKGAIFHYFGSKKNLYIYMVDLATNYFLERFKSCYIDPCSDIFERIMQIGVIKMKLYCEEPLMTKLVMEAFVDIPEEMEEEIRDRYNKLYSENMPIILQDMDYSLFRDDIDKQKATEFIMLCFDALYSKYTKAIKGKTLTMSNKDLDNMVKEYCEYMDMIKFGMYKKP